MIFRQPIHRPEGADVMLDAGDQEGFRDQDGSTGGIAIADFSGDIARDALHKARKRRGRFRSRTRQHPRRAAGRS
jgi:hypothetical protein